MSTDDIGKKIGIWASLATIIGVCVAIVALVPEFGQWLYPYTPSAESKTPVIIATDTPNALSFPTKPISDLWQFYVDDIKSTAPNALVDTETLKEISGKIPSSIPFLADEEVGIIPYQYTWTILDRESPILLNAPEGGYAYIAWGYGTVSANGLFANYQALEDNAYLILVIGKPNDNSSADLNTPLTLSDFNPGFSGTNFASPAKGQTFREREIVNEAWFSQQLWWASSHTSITVSFLDASNGQRLDYSINPDDFLWTEK